MSQAVVEREEIELMMWTLADIIVEVRQISEFLMGNDEEEEEEADT